MLARVLMLWLAFGAPEGTSTTTTNLTAKIETVLERPEAQNIGELEQAIRQIEARPEDVIDDSVLSDELLRARVVFAWAQQDPERATAAMDEAIRSAAGRPLPVRGLGTDLKNLMKQRVAALADAGTAVIEVDCTVPCQVFINEGRADNPTSPLALGTYRVHVVANEGDIDPLRTEVVLDVKGETERIAFSKPVEPAPVEPEPVPEPAAGPLEPEPDVRPQPRALEQESKGDEIPNDSRSRLARREKIMVITGGTLLGLSGVGIGMVIAGPVLVNQAEKDYRAGPTDQDRSDADRAGAQAESLEIAGAVSAGVLISAGVALILVGKLHKKQSKVSVQPVADRHNFGFSIRGAFLMKRRYVLLLIVGLGACYNPGSTLGLPCDGAGSCQGDQVCGPEGVCVDPDALLFESHCETGGEAPPEGAVAATYSYDLNTVADVSGGLTNWVATTPLPPGLTLDSNTGIISGIPEGPDDMDYALSVSVDDAITGETYMFDCEKIHINGHLSAMGVRDEPMHCIPHTSTYEEMVALLDGGDGTQINCSPWGDAGGVCPLGDGNGRPAPGVTFEASSCTHSGAITGDRRGTWVWMVEVEQSGYTTRVPFCASRDFETFHDITQTVNAQQESDLNPGLLEYDPDMAISFGNGTHVWDIVDPQCNSNPSQCDSFGFKFDVTCSPFDQPFQLDAVNNGVGINHDLTAGGPTPSTAFANRPWVGSFEMVYCTSANGANCDVDDPNFEQNAQTWYHYDVVAYPVLDNL